MEFTGERMMEEINNGGMYAEHMVRYKFASQFVKNKSVLDLACGSGYGSVFLKSMGAKEVKGIDISVETINYCNQKYTEYGVSFFIGNVDNIPVDSNSIDIIVSLETIEHVDTETQKKFLHEAKRVLKEDGIFIVSTPNVLVTPGTNPFHLKEFTYDDFYNLLSSYFPKVEIFFQDIVEASFITTDDFLKSGIDSSYKEFNVLNSGKLLSRDCLYFIAVCGKNTLDFEKKYIAISDARPWKKDIRICEEIENINKQLVQYNSKINLMELSKFWKLRSFFIKIKSFFFQDK